MQFLPHLPLMARTVVCRGRHWRLRRGDADGAVVDLEAVDHRGALDTLRLLCPPDVLQMQPTRVHQLTPRAWAHTLSAARVRGPGDEHFEAALEADVTPMPAQWVPMLALLSGRVRRLLLADDVGMGKTVQAGLLLRELHDRMPAARSLTVVPAGLVRQWDRELAERFTLQATVLDSTVLAERTHTGVPAGAMLPGEACLISMDTVRQPEVTALLAQCTWELLVVDEAHLLAPGTARRESISHLATTAGRLLLMTATPFTGDARNDRLLVSTGQRSDGADRMLIVSRTAHSMGRPAVRERVARPAPGAVERRLHRQLDAYVARAAHETSEGGVGHLAAMLLRRRACSSLHALGISLQRRLDLLGQPAAQPDTQLVLPLADEDDAHDAWLRVPAWRDLDSERATLRAIAADVRASTGPGSKVRWLTRWMRRCREPVLVFTEYADTLRTIRKHLVASRTVTCIYGAQTGDQRHLAVERFCAGEVDVLLATDAAAEGLNLHHRCRLVVHVDVPWSPRRLAQRTGRLDRLGQRHRVHSTILVARGTNDEHVLATLAGRQSRVAAALDNTFGDLAVVASPRRLAVAVRALDATGAARGRRSRRDGDVWCTRVATARGRRLARALNLPAGHVALALVHIGMSGVHPLVRSRSWIGCSPRDTAEALTLTSADLARLRPVARFMRRAQRRSQRLAAQDAHTPHQAFGTGHLFDVPVHPSGPHRLQPLPPEAQLHVLTLRVLSWGR